MPRWSRRDMLRGTALGAAVAALGRSGSGLFPPRMARSQEPGERPARAEGARVLNPRGRVPVSLIIDDSTCLVNLAHFAIPQFAQVFPENYKQDWKALPREIPDRFVRKFGEWCQDHGVKGKYSIVPFPACVGWVDREMPGWSRRELQESLDLVRTLMVPNWDIHPEMVTHTWVIDTRTGRPFPEKSERFMENWRWTDDKTADQIADYMAYALRMLKNAGLPCEGITTPGGFGNRVLPQLAEASFQSLRDVYHAEIPHYFRHLYTDDRSVAPRVEYASGLGGANPRCVVSIIGCTGDWFGGWDGLEAGSVDQFITEDLKGGRLPEVIARDEPAVLVCHWPGIYFNGEEVGFQIFQEVVRRLSSAYDNLLWMKLSEIARYWAARELTAIARSEYGWALAAPYACPAFTLDVPIDEGRRQAGPPEVVVEGQTTPLGEVRGPLQLVPGTFTRNDRRITVCFDLPKGAVTLKV